MTLYLDHAASTPVDAQVAEAMDRILRSDVLQANPAARHAPGRAARACVDEARLDVARLIGAGGEEIVWTSGATESNNLAVIGTARFRAARGRHLVTCLTEHPSVTAAFRHLATQGFEVSWLEPGTDGILAPEQLAAALRPDTTVVSVMHVNNETGVVQDVAALGALCRSRDVLFHVDAVQAAGRERIDVREQGIDLLSLSAHKMYGPKGVGALYVGGDRVRRVEPLLFGGGQERGMRPGTIATHQVVGMGVAARLAGERLGTDPARIRLLTDELWARLRALPGVLRNGHPTRRACHVLNLSVVGVEGESLLYGLRELAVSAGSACTSGDAEPSAVLRCLGRSDELARSSVRFSLGRGNTLADVDCAADRFSAAVAHLRRLSPATPG